MIKKMNDNEQIEFINKLNESDYSSWNFKDLLTSVKSDEGKNILFKKWFSDDSSNKLIKSTIIHYRKNRRNIIRFQFNRRII